MTKYRKKPVVIEAEQWTGNNKNILNFTNGTAAPLEGHDIIIIPTQYGDMWAELGDWIIKGVDDKLYVVKINVFEETYELVE